MKEVKPTLPTPRIKYEYVGKKENLQDIVTRTFPKELIPTKRTGYIFGTIFVLVVILGIVQFPFGALLSGKTDIAIEIGIPKTFLSFDLANPETFPLNIAGILIDLLIYVVLSYAIDIVITLFLKNTKFKIGKSESPTKEYTVQTNKQTIIDKAAEAAAKKVSK